jgi:hypothetical protein
VTVLLGEISSVSLADLLIGWHLAFEPMVSMKSGVESPPSV